MFPKKPKMHFVTAYEFLFDKKETQFQNCMCNNYRQKTFTCTQCMLHSKMSPKSKEDENENLTWLGAFLHGDQGVLQWQIHSLNHHLLL